MYVWSATVCSPNVGALSTALTSTETGKLAVSPSASVAVRVYVVAGWTAVGVPVSVPPAASTAADGVYVSPAGRSGGVTVYVSGGSPPVAAGSVSVTAVPTVYVWSATVCSPNVGCRSAGAGCAPVANANVTSASLLLASTIVSVYCRCDVRTVGVPTICPPLRYTVTPSISSLIGGMYVSPAGNAGVTKNVRLWPSGFLGAGNCCGGSIAWFSGYGSLRGSQVANPGSGFAATVTANVRVGVFASPSASVAVSVYVAAVAAVAGVPRSRRVAASYVSPSGSVRLVVAGNGPVNVCSTGGLPPVAPGNRTLTRCPARYVCAATAPSVGVSSSISCTVMLR